MRCYGVPRCSARRQTRCSIHHWLMIAPVFVPLVPTVFVPLVPTVFVSFVPTVFVPLVPTTEFAELPEFPEIAKFATEFSKFETEFSKFAEFAKLLTSLQQTRFRHLDLQSFLMPMGKKSSLIV